MSTRSRPPRPARAGLHPRNRHQGRYDLQTLARACPTLRPHIIRAADRSSTLDFSQPAAVLALNQALLQEQYGIRGWTLPEGYLCPPVPGRADYIHALADLLGASHDGKIPTGDGLVGLDVGTGANLIYPLLGRSEYGWRFVGSDIDQAALANAAQILAANPTLAVGIELRHQRRPEQIFGGLVGGDERFDFTLCNPPFHADLAEATRGSQRKWRNLGRDTDRQPLLNFGGRHNELMCDGGEAGFLSRMIDQSAAIAGQVFWFTTLVSRAANLPPACPTGHTAGTGCAGNPHGSGPEAEPPAGLDLPRQETAPGLAKSSLARLPDGRSRAGSTQALLNSSSKPGSQILNPL